MDTSLQNKDEGAATMYDWETQHRPSIYSGAFHTVCMTARVKSHDSRYMGGQTHAHMQAEGVEEARECGRGLLS